MAEPHTLKIGDKVTHPEWEDGETRTIVNISHFSRLDGATRKLKKDPEVRIIHLDKPVVTADSFPGDPPDDAWMEAGLVIVEQGNG